MKRSIRMNLTTTFLCILLGCSVSNNSFSTNFTDDTRTPATVQHGALTKNEKLPITIPENAGDEMSQKRLTLYMDIGLTNSSEKYQIGPKSKQALRNYIESQIPKLKRFDVYSVFNNQAKRLSEDLQDIGDMEYSESEQLPPPDLLLNISIDVQSEEHTSAGRASKNVDPENKQDRIYYTLVTSVNLSDKNSKILDAESFENDAYRVVEKTYSRRLGKYEFKYGFDPHDADNVNAVLQEVVRHQLVNIALWLGKKYPITGKVLGIRGMDAGIDKGIQDGMINGIDVVLWCENDWGLAYPLAACTVQARSKMSTIKMVRLEMNDPGAVKIVARLKDGKGEEIFDSGEWNFYATSYSMPIPEDWMP